MARHGYLWEFPTEVLLRNPAFVSIEERFWAASIEARPLRSPIPLPPSFPAQLTPPLTSLDPTVWELFVQRISAQPELIANWGWPTLEKLGQIAQVLGQWSQRGRSPRLTLRVNETTCEMERFGGEIRRSLHCQIRPPLALGTELPPGLFAANSAMCFRSLDWGSPQEIANSRTLVDQAGTPADFPGLASNYPAAAWKFFLKLADCPLSEH